MRGGAFLASAREVAELVVGVSDGPPVHLRDVATVTDGMAEADTYTRIGFGPAADVLPAESVGREYQAVNIAVAKKKGTNAVNVADDVIAAVHAHAGDDHPRRCRGAGHPQLRRDRQPQGERADHATW